MARGQLTFFLLLCPLTWHWADILRGSGKKTDLSLLTAVHCTAEPIKLKVQFDTAFIYTVDKREGGEGACVPAFVCR